MLNEKGALGSIVVVAVVVGGEVSGVVMVEEKIDSPAGAMVVAIFSGTVPKIELDCEPIFTVEVTVTEGLTPKLNEPVTAGKEKPLLIGSTFGLGDFVTGSVGSLLLLIRWLDIDGLSTESVVTGSCVCSLFSSLILGIVEKMELAALTVEPPKSEGVVETLNELIVVELAPKLELLPDCEMVEVFANSEGELIEALSKVNLMLDWLGMAGVDVSGLPKEEAIWLETD